ATPYAASRMRQRENAPGRLTAPIAPMMGRVMGRVMAGMMAGIVTAQSRMGPAFFAGFRARRFAIAARGLI
ncbi:MAG: hypothetical protein AAFQ96_08540, partial [Pseudomonadota bacterium]